MEEKMLVSEGRFTRIHNKKYYAARVEIQIDPTLAGGGITFDCKGEGWLEQGAIEEVPAQGYDHWKHGAQVGIEYAWQIYGGPPVHVTVTKILGMHLTDTNPTIVAAAAMDALWRAFDFEPPERIQRHVEEVVFGSWALPSDLPANFTEL